MASELFFRLLVGGTKRVNIYTNYWSDVDDAAKTTGLTPFHRVDDMLLWVHRNSRGWVGCVQANARIICNPWCDGDMRIVGIFAGRWT